MTQLLILQLFLIDFGLANIYKPYSYGSATFQETPNLKTRITCGAFCNCQNTCSAFHFNNEEKICQIVESADQLAPLENVTNDDPNIIFVNPASLDLDISIEILFPRVEQYSTTQSVIGDHIFSSSSKFIGFMFKYPETVIFTTNYKEMFEWNTKIYNSSGLTTLDFPLMDRFLSLHRPISFQDKTVWFSGSKYPLENPFVIYANETYEDLPKFPVDDFYGECLTAIDDIFYVVGGTIWYYDFPVTYIWEFSFEFRTYKNITEHPTPPMENGGCVGHTNERGEKIIFSLSGNHELFPSRTVNYYNLDQDRWAELPNYPAQVNWPRLLIIDNILFAIGGYWYNEWLGLRVNINQVRRLNLDIDDAWHMLDHSLDLLNGGENLLIWKYSKSYRLP